MASSVGMEALNGPRDMDKVRRDLKAGGYNGERVALIAATDFPVLKAMADVTADMKKRAGLNVDHQDIDWGSTCSRPPTAPASKAC